MFRSVPLPLVVPLRRPSRLQRAAARVTLFARSLEHRAERAGTEPDHEEHLAQLRHRIFSRYY